MDNNFGYEHNKKSDKIVISIGKNFEWLRKVGLSLSISIRLCLPFSLMFNNKIF